MPRIVHWDNKNYVTVYQLARDGLPAKRIAEALGISRPTFMSWLQKYPALKDALNRGRSAAGNRAETFADHVLGRLPPELHAVWNEISNLGDEDNSEKRLETLMKHRGRRFKQHLFVAALLASHFSAYDACKKIGIAYSQYRDWQRNDPDFAGIFEHIIEMKKDFVEGCLLGLVGSGDSAATIYASRTLNKDRGYDPKLTVEHTGGVTHTHAHLNLDKIIPMLSPKAQREILGIIEKQEAKMLPVHEDDDTEDAEYEVA